MEKRVRYVGAVVRSSKVLAWVVLVGAAGCSVPPEPDATTRVEGAVSTLPSVVTQHNDLGRTGANLNEVILTPSLVGTKGKFGKLGKLPVDGQIYGQPLYVPGIIGGKNAVFVATEKNKVYAFDADSLSPTPLWERDLEAAWMPASFCGNSASPYGINSTPVIDPATSTMYVAVRTATASNGTRHLLHALSLADGTEKQSGPLDMGVLPSGAAVTAPTPTGGTVTFDPSKHQNRVALTLSANHILSIGFGSYCDQDSYHGWLMRFDVSTSPITRLVPYVTTPTTSRGAPAGRGQRLRRHRRHGRRLHHERQRSRHLEDDGAARQLGDLAGQCLHQAHRDHLDHRGADSQELVPALELRRARQCRHRHRQLRPFLLIPGTTLILGGGKGGVLYLLNRDPMGGFNAAGDTQVVQEFAASAGQWIVGSPVFWNRGTTGNSARYIWPGKTPLEQYAFDATAGKFTPTSAPAPAFKSTVNPQDDLQGGNLALSANGATSGSGILWATHCLSSAAGGGGIVPGALYAFNAENVTSELWDSNMVTGDKLASYAKYTVPTVVNGKVYVSTFSSEVDVYGLFPTSVDGGVRDAGAPQDANTGPVLLTCANVDGGAAQPTTWSYVYNTYFAGNNTPDGGLITIGHCAECHLPGGRGAGFFLSGNDKDAFYQGLIAIHQINPDAGASSAFGLPNASPLAWFGSRTPGTGIFQFLPQDVQAQDIPNAQGIAAVCGCIRAGAINNVVCPTGQTACNNVCFDLTSSNAHCGSCTNACATGSTCLSGLCCASGFVNCGGTCVNLTASPNCGSCGNVCATGKTCTNKTCLSITGQTCGAGTECVSGFCVDNVCCGSSSCSGTCMACSNARTGQPSGTCAAISSGGADSRCLKAPPCGFDGMCNGTGACRNTVSGTNCGAASCTSGTQRNRRQPATAAARA